MQQSGSQGTPWYRNRNFFVLLAVLAVIAAVLAASYLINPAPATPPPADTSLTAAGYVYIMAGEEARWFALPEGEDTILQLTRGDVSNTIRLSKEGVVMASSSCDNQDCVMQGEVTLANKDQRDLRNMIICLPNDVGIELYSRDELAALLAQ